MASSPHRGDGDGKWEKHIVAPQNIGPLDHVCWVRKGYLLGSQVPAHCLVCLRPNTWC